MLDYDKTWQHTWKDSTVHGPTPRHRRRIIASLVRKLQPGTVLDLGCGDGCMLKLLSSSTKASLFGADISEAALNKARISMPEVEYFHLDMSLDLPDRIFDVIIMSEVLEHIEKDDELLARLSRSTRFLVLSVPGGAADKVETRYGHYRNYHGKLLAEKLAANGFEVIHYKRWGMPFYELMHWLVATLSDPYKLGEGNYGPLKRITGKLIYALFFFNFMPAGRQVFAVGKSAIQPGSK